VIWTIWTQVHDLDVVKVLSRLRSAERHSPRPAAARTTTRAKLERQTRQKAAVPS
jgi:hypothetical protein